MDPDAPEAGTPQAAADLYDEYSGRLYAYVLSLTGDPARSEDVVHDAFVRLIEYSSRRDLHSVEGFLFTVARNLVLDARRRTARFRGVSVPLPLASTDGSDDAGLADAVSLALGSLPEEQRETVVLKIYSGLTFAAIGEVTGTSLATAASRYRLGLERMAGVLSKERNS